MDVPQQITGKQSDNAAAIDLGSVPDAKVHFQKVRERLLDVNRWKDLTGKIGAEFLVHDRGGNALDRPARKDDYIRINIPGPGLSAGNGYDWVKVLEITEGGGEEDADEIAMTVRPSDNPQTASDETAHFFEESATSTFMAKRLVTVVRAEVHGRNEKPNTSLSQNLDKVRNTVVATGATTMFSDIQWRSLVEALVKRE